MTKGPRTEAFSLKPARQYLIEVAREAIDDVQTCVVPLFNADEDGKAQLLGSAILIEVMP